MVEVMHAVYGSRPTYRGWVECTCDLCGARCSQDGSMKQKLYQFNGDQLCFDCLWDALEMSEIVKTVQIE